MPKIRWVSRVPDELRKALWPARLQTTWPRAAKSFFEEHGVWPEVVVCESRDLNWIQPVVHMYAPGVRDAVFKHLVKKLGEKPGAREYRRHVKEVLHGRRDEGKATRES